MNINEITKHLYNDSVELAIKYVNSIKDEETLYVYAYNYNWDDGFNVPIAILCNPVCSMSIALLLFHLADGTTFLFTKETNKNLLEWSEFISYTYEKIKSKEFKTGKVAFTPELSKVQLFKLRKVLSEEEYVFIDEIEGIDCNISI